VQHILLHAPFPLCFPSKPAIMTQLSTIPDDMWVNVTWMPHSSLSQKSHVTMVIRSAHVIRDRRVENGSSLLEWRVQVSVRGMGGLDVVSVKSCTPAAALRPRQFPLVGPTVQQSTHECIWNHVLEAPVRWRDLPRDAYLYLEIIGQSDRKLYETTFPLFETYGKLKMGLQRLDMTLPGKFNHSLNPGLEPRSDKLTWDEEDQVWKASKILDELKRLEQTPKKVLDAPPTSNFGHIQSVPWLDSITKEHCNEILAAVEESYQNVIFVDDDAPPILLLEMPFFDVPVLHEETFYPTPLDGACGGVTALELALARKQVEETHLSLVPFLDYESEQNNPVEDKYRTLAHDLLRGLVDPALKPDREQRDRLAAIIASPSHHPTREEKDLLWRFRFSLVDNRSALTKFLLAVDWEIESEVVQAAELLEQWRKRSPIEVTDALRLLGKHVAFQTNLVRSYAIDTLASAPDDELRLYLLQLVQAIKYEDTEQTVASSLPLSGQSSTKSSRSGSSLAHFLIERAAKNIELANFLYWYLKVELQDPTYGARYVEVFSALEDKLSTAMADSSLSQDSKGKSLKSILGSVSKLGSSRRDHKVQRTVWEVLTAQDEFISSLMEIQMSSRDARGKKDAKELHLREALAAGGFDRKLAGKPVPLPSAPHILVDGLYSQSAKMFKSALYPALIEFRVASCLPPIDDSDFRLKDVSARGSQLLEQTTATADSLTSYRVIVKTGDDLRQDQLVIMMIQLMDGLLKRGALDLCLTPYSIIAMSPTSGLVEFVDASSPISQVLASHNNSILAFFQSKAPKKGAKYNVKSEVMSNYVRSCAGYCVITYLLGVGDRHLDNIMLQTSGHFFHIDFGFIFGRDPKPLPPAFRLTREMVDGMGGMESSEYRQFCSLACQAFNTLRKSAGLVLNLLHLMSDAGIGDLSNNPSANADGVISSVELRFRLDLADEDAERYFISLINDSLAALAPRVMDVFHSLAVARR